MGKIAFVFSGQGAQAPGMGQSLCEASAAAKAVFDMADALRPGTSAQCFSGTQEELTVTENTQPCLFTVDLAAASALEEAGMHPDAVAGFSLGEIAALAFAGVCTREEGFSFVCQRAKAMAEAGAAHPGAMAAVLKLSNEQVEALCGEFQQVWPVNYNCPGQLVVAGESGELEAFREKVAQAGGKAVPLAVSGGFHSPFMDSAVPLLEKALAPLTFQAPALPLYANATGELYGEDGKELVLRQVNHPVRWQEIITAMADQGVDTFVECGVGKTLCGLIKKTVKGAKVYNVEDARSLAATVEALKKVD